MLPDQNFAAFIKSSTKAQNILALLMILVFIGINIMSVRDLSVTTDEDKHYRYGMNILALNSERFDDSKMPMSALNALPARLADFLPPGNLQAFLKKIIVARMMTALFSALASFLTFWWARRLYGPVAGLAALSLYIFDPNIIAHSQLVTTDIYATGTVLFFTCSLWKFAQTRQVRDGLICATMLGFSLLAKYTAIVLFPLGILALILHDFPTIKEAYRASGMPQIWSYIRWILTCILITLVLSLFIVNVGFLFNRSFTAFKDYKLRSTSFLKIRNAVPTLGSLLIPIPYPYLQGLDLVVEREETGFGYGRIYFFGQLHEHQGFPGYYIAATFLKMPLASQILLWIAVVTWFARRRYLTSFLRNEIFLFIPVLFFTIYFNFFYATQIGLRFYLVVFPLLFIFASSIFDYWPDFSPHQKMGLAALLIYLVVSVFSYYPNFLSYFNEIVLDRKYAYRYLADSNIEWGQNKDKLRQYLLGHPNALYSPTNVRPGYFIVNVNDLVGVASADPEQYSWLRNNFEPVDTIAYSYMIYKISPEEIDHLCATTEYCDK